MQHIPDNEFDRLFKDRLAHAEVQPSAELWDKIAPRIAPKKKRSIVLYWSAAASVMIAISAGLLFRPQEKIALQAPVAAVAGNAQSAGNGSEVSESVALNTVQEKNRESSRVRTDVYAGKIASAPKEQSIAPNENILAVVQPVANADHHLNTAPIEEAIVTTPLEHTAPDNALAINNSPVDVEPAMAEALTENGTVEQQTRPKIRNAGDLVNFVVEKIDKREQKLVEFRTDEDEGSSLVAINIGPLKINQRRHR